MSVRDKKNITLLNYCSNIVIVSTKDTSYSIPAADGDTPSTLSLSFEEIQYINSNSPAFKDGTLRFEKEIEKEMYEELHITNWEDILTNDQIEETIMHPTYEKLEKVIKVNSLSIIGRIRGVLIALKNEGTHDISSRVERIIETRYKELLRGQVNTGITITKKDTQSVVSAESIALLKEENADIKRQNEDMQKQLHEMKALMEQMVEQNSAKKEAPENSDLVQQKAQANTKAPAKRTASKPK